MESKLVRVCVAAALAAVLGGCGDSASSEDGEAMVADVQPPSPIEGETVAAEEAEPEPVLVAEVDQVVAVPGRGRQWKVVGTVRNDGQTVEHGVELVVRLSSRANSLPVATHAMDVRFERALSPGDAQTWEITLQLPRSSAQEVSAQAEVTTLLGPARQEDAEQWKPLVLPQA